MHVCTSHQSDLLAAFTSRLLLSEIGSDSAIAVFAAAKEKDWVRLLALVEENPQSEHLQYIRDQGLGDDAMVIASR